VKVSGPLDEAVPQGRGHLRSRSHRNDSREKPAADKPGDRTKTDLIFPYRQNSAHDEPSDAKCPKLPGSFGTMEVERTTRTSSREKAIRTGLISIKDDESITDYIDLFSVHLPYRKMGEKALAYLLRHEWRHLPRWKYVIKEVAMEEPLPKDPRGTIESILADTEFMKADEKFRRAFVQTSFYNEIFEKKMASSLEASAIIGNLYTASMYMGFRSLLEFEYKKGTDLETKRVGFGSYGSGSSAMVFSGVIQPQYKEIVKRMNLEEEIGPRKKVSMEEYGKLHENGISFNDSILQTNKEFILAKIGGTTADKAGLREYTYIN
jgi:hydroxymethylglutaryl-CoA synthase